MNKYYITDIDNRDNPSYHCIGFSDLNLNYLFSPLSIRDAKLHLFNYDFHNILSWYQTTNGYEVTMILYNL